MVVTFQVVDFFFFFFSFWGSRFFVDFFFFSHLAVITKNFPLLFITTFISSVAPPLSPHQILTYNDAKLIITMCYTDGLIPIPPLFDFFPFLVFPV